MPQLSTVARRSERRLPTSERPRSVERTLSYVEAIREATDLELARDPAVVVFGLDVDDPKAIQGTLRGLAEKYGPERVFGTPLSEDAMTGAEDALHVRRPGAGADGGALDDRQELGPGRPAFAGAA
jgi:Transketolase, pyrimidine binding domain